jgi:ribonuclease BN (tRNA processing enzyme)
MLELSFLGSGDAFTHGGRYWSSFLLNGRYLFEAPPTALPHLKRLRVPLTDIEAVFITHFHGDHFLGLPFLFLEYLYQTPRRNDLHIVGPPGVQGVIEQLTNIAFSTPTDADVAYQRFYLEAAPETEQAVADVHFRAVLMKHATRRLKSFGYRLNVGKKVLAYTGDTEFCEEIFTLAEGADVLVLDCNYSDNAGPEHMGFAEALEVRKRLPLSTTIILTHLEAEPNIRGMKGLLTAQDFATFRFP